MGAQRYEYGHVLAISANYQPDEVKHGQFGESAEFVAEMRWPMRSGAHFTRLRFNSRAKTGFLDVSNVNNRAQFLYGLST